MQLRDYQQKACREIQESIDTGYKRMLLVAGTGTGKTVIGAKLTQDTICQEKKLLFLVHRDILIKQTRAKFQQFGIEAGVIAGQYSEEREKKVQIASIQTLTNRKIDWFEFNLAIFDECHITSWSSVGLELYPLLRTNPCDREPMVGLTATPFRLNPKEQMGDLYQRLVKTPFPAEMIEAGYLKKPVYYRIAQIINTEGIPLDKNRDYSLKRLSIRCNVPETIACAVQGWKAKAKGRQTIAFTVDVSHAKALAQEFIDQKVKAVAVDGTMSIKLREKYYEQLANGEVEVLVSCEALSEGFDVPIVSCALLCRPTKSMAKFTQQTGRALRYFDGIDDALILDQCELIKQFGYIEDFVDYELEESLPSSKKQPPPLKTCPSCSALLPNYYRSCPHCSNVFPEVPKYYPIGELERILIPSDLQKFEFFQNTLREAYQKNLAPGWASIQYQEKYKSSPPSDWSRGAIFGDNPNTNHKKTYRQYLEKVAARAGHSWVWIDRQMNCEFLPS
jgi:superfamily II DNA or RNA helicase